MRLITAPEMEMNKQEIIKTQEDTIRIPIKHNDEPKKIQDMIFKR